MASSTTNLGLVKPAYNEAADVAVINGNMDTIDTAVNKNTTGLAAAEGAIAILADGDSHVAISKGDFVYVRNNTHSLTEGLYTATANVSANGNITGSNMTAVSKGGLNALQGSVSDIVGAISLLQSTSATTHEMTFGNSGAYVLFVGSNATGMRGVYEVGTTSGGVVVVTAVESAGITTTTATNKVTFSVGTTARPLTVLAITLRGTAPTF